MVKALVDGAGRGCQGRVGAQAALRGAGDMALEDKLQIRQGLRPPQLKKRIPHPVAVPAVIAVTVVAVVAAIVVAAVAVAIVEQRRA